MAKAKVKAPQQTQKKGIVNVKPTPKKVREQKPEFEVPEDLFTEAMPEDFEFGKYKPLRRSDFAQIWMYIEHRALEAEFKAELLHAEAARVKKLGSSADRNKAKRYLKMSEKMEELRKQLEEAGFDTDTLLEDEKEEEDGS